MPVTPTPQLTAREVRNSGLETQTDAPQCSEIGFDTIPGLDLERLQASAGGDDLAGLQRKSVARQLVDEPDESDPRVIQNVRPGALPLKAADNPADRPLGRKVQHAPVIRGGRSENEQVTAGIVGDELWRPDGGEVLIPGVGHLDRWVEARDGVHHLLDGVGSATRRKVTSHAKRE